jgi:hypothetical protein
VVGQIGIDPLYYLDEMSHDEVVAVMKARHESYGLMSREAWEQTRTSCFYTVAAIGGKVKQPKDLFKLPWDNENKRPVVTRTKEEALKALEAMKQRKYGKQKS